MKKAMNYLTRALALLLVFAMAVAYVPMTGIVFKASAASDTTVSFSAVPTNGTAYTSAPLQNKERGGYINLGMTCGFETGRGSGYSNMLTADKMQALYDTGYLTVGGGMTIENLKTGLYGFVVADGATYQLNWKDRSEGFPDGSYFTLKQGAELPYVNGSGNANMALDVTYTFKFKATANTAWWNEVEITRVKETSFGMNTGEWGNGNASNTLTNSAFTNADSVTGYTTKYQRIDNDEKYVDYINVAGLDLLTLESTYGAKIQYILDGSNKLIQFTWGTLKDVLKTGDQIILKKGLPVPYMAGGVSCIAYLDSDYVFQVVGSNADNTQVFRGLAYDPAANQFTLATGAKNFFDESGIQKINLGFTYTDSTTSLTGPYTNMYAGEMVKDYIEISSCTLDEINATGANLYYIAAAKVLQFEYNAALKAILKPGDTITFKKGMPVIINDTSKLVSATLANTYECTMTDTGMNIVQVDDYSLTGSSYPVYTEGATKYIRLDYTTGLFTDFPNGEKDLTAADAGLYDYINVNGVTGTALKDAGYYFKIYKPGNTFFRLYKSGTDFPVNSGSTIVFKKGLPVDYTAGGVVKRAVLDKDYGFVYNGTNYVYDPAITFPEAPAGLEYGLTTKLNVTSGGNENGVKYWDSAITGTQVAYTSYDWGTVTDADKDAYIDWSHVTNADVVKAGTTVKMILASDATKIVRILLTDAAIAALRNGDYITLKKGMPLTTNNNQVITVLDKDYEINIVNNDGVSPTVNFTIPAGDFALNAAGANQQGPEGTQFYVPMGYSDPYFADIAAGRQVVSFNELQNFLLVSGKDTAALLADGWDIQLLHSEAKQFRIRYVTAPGVNDTAVILLKGLPVTYTSTDGTYKTAHLDKTYGYWYDGSKFSYDASLTELPKPIEDHTPQLGNYPGGTYGYFDYKMNANFASKPSGLIIGVVGDTAVYENGVGKYSFSGYNNGYIAYNGTAVAEHTYVISYWVNVSKVSGTVGLDAFSDSRAGSPTPGRYNNNLQQDTIQDGENYTITINGQPLTEPISAATDGWVHIEIKWTAKSDGDYQVGLLRNLGGSGSATVYLDDVMVFDTTAPEFFENGYYAVDTGKWAGIGDDSTNKDGTGLHTNLVLTTTSLGRVEMGNATYWQADLNYELWADYVGDFGGLTVAQMKQYGVQMKLIKDTANDVLVLQIRWGTALEHMEPNAQIDLKKDFPVDYVYEGSNYRVFLSNDITIVRRYAPDQDIANVEMTTILTDRANPIAGDYDGDGLITDQDRQLCRMYLAGAYTGIANQAANADGSADGDVNSLDLLWIFRSLDSGLLDNNPMKATIDKAVELANQVQFGYTDAKQSAYWIQNNHMKITHDLGTANQVGTLTTPDGTTDFLGGGGVTPYIVWNNSTMGVTQMSNAHPIRVNTTIMGAYYNSTYVRDMSWRRNTGNFASGTMTEILWFEKGYHTYPDKLHQTYRLVSGGTTESGWFGTPSAPEYISGLTEFGLTLTIPSYMSHYIKYSSDAEATVDPLKPGESVTGRTDIEFVAFAVPDADEENTVGIFGLIFNTVDGSKVSVEMTSDGSLVVKQYLDLGSDFQFMNLDDIYFGNRVYTDNTDNLDGIMAASYEEHYPLTKAAITMNSAVDNATFLGYDNMRGLYNFKVDGHGFGTAWENPDEKFIAGISIAKSPVDRNIYICVNTDNELEGAAVLNEDEVQLPIMLQVNKNFGHENEEPVYYPESNATDAARQDGIRGEAYMPLVIEAGKTQSFEIVHVMQNWGKFPLKQLSSIEYYTPYYHLSTGVTETNCIAPFGVGFRDTTQTGKSMDPVFRQFNFAWLLPDFRGMSGSGQYSATGTPSEYQHNSGATVMMPTSNKGMTTGRQTTTEIVSSGMTYADLIMNYEDESGNFKYSIRHMEMPQTDESRTYYTLEFEILQDCTLTPDNFNIMGVGGRMDGNYSKGAYLDANGNVSAFTPKTSGNYELLPLQSGSSYFTLYDLSKTDMEHAQVGLIVKDYSITQNGSASNAGLAVMNYWLQPKDIFEDGYTVWGGEPINYSALVLNGNQTFQKGDTIKVDLILLSYGKIDQKHYDNVKNVYEDSVTNPIKVTEVEIGEKVGTDPYIPTVKCENDEAVFTVSGGTYGDNVTNYTIKVTGFKRVQMPTIWELIDGKWVKYEYASVSAFDGYSAQYENGSVTYSFVIAKGKEDRTFAINTVEPYKRPSLNFSGADMLGFTDFQTTKTVVEGTKLSVTTTAVEGYFHNSGLNLDAPQTQQVVLRVKVDTPDTVNQLHIGVFGDFLKDGMIQTNMDYTYDWDGDGNNDGAFIIYAPLANYTKGSDGYYEIPLDLTKNMGIEWTKIRGFRVGFSGPAAGTEKTITIESIKIVE